MEKALLSGGCHKMEYRESGIEPRNKEPPVEIRRFGISVTNKIIIYPQIPRCYPARQTFFPENTSSGNGC